MATMKAALQHGIRDIRIEDIPRPTPGPGEALVRIKAVGICGSDVHYYTRGRIGSQIVKGPHILGHEPSGEIAEVGKGGGWWTRYKMRYPLPVVPGNEITASQPGSLSASRLRIFRASPRLLSTTSPQRVGRPPTPSQPAGSSTSLQLPLLSADIRCIWTQILRNHRRIGRSNASIRVQCGQFYTP